MSAIKVLDVEVDKDAAGRALSHADVNRALFGRDPLTRAEKSRVLALIHGLDGKEFIHLMYVGQLKNLCEFENPSTELRSGIALDYELRDNGLTKIEVNPDVGIRCRPTWPS